jgi:hypothetical protein
MQTERFEFRKTYIPGKGIVYTDGAYFLVEPLSLANGWQAYFQQIKPASRIAREQFFEQVVEACKRHHTKLQGGSVVHFS